MNTSKTLAGAGGLLMIVALATPGCATKKYARQQAGAVDQRVSEVDKKHTEAISTLEAKEQKDVSRVEERAMGAENKANDAARAAQAADQKAGQAGESARNATNLAQQAQSRIGDVSRVVQNIDSFKLVTSEGVLFGFDKAMLTKDGKAKLDSLVQNTQGMGRYIIEVQGFTDRTGSRDYNLALSRRRADAVVRYLVDKGVPLRRIHMIGLGYEAEQPMAASMTGQTGMAPEQGTPQKLTRKEMRRVLVNIYAPEATLSASNAPGQGQSMSTPAPETSAPAPTQDQVGTDNQAAPS
ncbi:MAG TPA: OmpA family protein, partial [Bryobacteraceae bacterium]|nr:OmpA family protein [Bryobacteraceae bacterium]